MRWLSNLKKPVKVFIAVVMFVTFLLLAAIVCLEITNNSMFESMSRYFVGDTESEITVDEIIPYERQEIKDGNLNKGVTETRQKGKNGKKTITFRVTKDKDGNEINRTYVGEEIAVESVDEIVAIGTKVPTPANNNNSKSSTSNNKKNNSSQSSNSRSNTSQSATGGNTIPARYCKRTWPIGSREKPYIYYYMAKITQSCQEYFGTRDADGRSYMEVSSKEYYSADFVSGPTNRYLESRRKLCTDWYNGGIEMCK